MVNKTHLFIAIYLLTSLPIFAQVKPQLQLDILQFQENNQPYIELQVLTMGNSLVQVPTPDQKWRSAIQLFYYFEKDGVIEQYDNILLSSPAFEEKNKDFVHLLRYALMPGDYTFHLEATDANKLGDTLTLDLPLTVDRPGEVWGQSDPLLSYAAHPAKEKNNLARSGFIIEPAPYQFFTKNQESLFFYQEVYCNDTTLHGTPYYYSYRVTSQLSAANVPGMETVRRKRRAKPKDPILYQIDIRSLPSGNYTLFTTVEDSLSRPLSERKVNFQRSNPELDLASIRNAGSDQLGQLVVVLDSLEAAELNYILRACAPRAWDTDVEILNAVIRNQSVEAKRNFILNFFGKMDANMPYLAYQKYMEAARNVDDQFKSGMGFGFESDRGWILMKYGRPNEMIDVDNEPQAPPYQIWVYDLIEQTGQRNVKFLFYNPSLAVGNFLLLHSTARNELQNPRWEIELYSRGTGNQSQGINVQDATRAEEGFFHMARRYFEDN
jgi:GWxTD domain-containing protein